MKKLYATIASAALMGLPLAASATSGPPPNSVSVQATVSKACTVLTPASLSFNYDPTAPLATSSTSGNETIQCTKTTGWTLQFASSSVTLSGTSPNTDTLSVGSLSASPASSASATGAPENFTVSGSIGPGHYVTPDTYSGSVLVTASF